MPLYISQTGLDLRLNLSRDRPRNIKNKLASLEVSGCWQKALCLVPAAWIFHQSSDLFVLSPTVQPDPFWGYALPAKGGLDKGGGRREGGGALDGGVPMSHVEFKNRPCCVYLWLVF